ncbi:MAG TPA: FixH family protein [Aquamicrobium sp.]|nr:FixH family protein [Aquamicrobium sp.]
MSERSAKTGEFTGKHMLAIMLAFFGVIIAVNLTMATFARTSWSGLVVQNSYVAGQHFNRLAEEGREQAALGWTPAFAIEGGVLRFALTDADGKPVRLESGTAALRRPVGDADDTQVALAASDGALEAALGVADGAWIVEVHATAGAEAGLERPWRETRRIQLHGGNAR